MSEPWFNISNIKINPDKTITANAVAEADSRWFSGHFPGNPILPGIAQVSMAVDLIKDCFAAENKGLTIKSLKKVKFRSLIKPGEILDIQLTSGEKQDNVYTFKITASGNSVCSGIIQF